MKINNLKINGFGKLENKEIKLNSNINLIYGENEAGKTTLLKFISGIFFGVSKNKNKKEFSDLERYKPWQEKEFSGKINYNLDNNENYEVFRDFNKKNPKIFKNGEDISKDFNIDKTKGSEFFYEQTGIDEPTFLSTSVAEQKEVVLDNNDQNFLVQKIANMISTGEENVSYKKTIQTLSKKQLEEVGSLRTVGRPLNVINDKIEELEQKQRNIGNSDEQKNILEKRQQIINRQIDEKETQLKLVKKVMQRNTNLNVQDEKIKINNEMLENEKIKINNVKNKIDEDEINYLLYEENSKLLNIEQELENGISSLKLQLHTNEIDYNNILKKSEEKAKIQEELQNSLEEKRKILGIDKAINIAKEAMERAYERMKNEITPKFTNNLSEIAKKISSNKYNRVKFIDGEGLVVELENGDYINSNKLSIGTIDQLYLSLRLSALQEVTQEKMPIILDEAFAYYDNKRLENILKYINEEFKENQIIIFTCSNREKEIMEKNGIAFNYDQI